MFPDLIRLLKFHIATFSSVLSGPVVFPGMCTIPKDKFLQQGLSVLLHLGKKNFLQICFLTTHNIC